MSEERTYGSPLGFITLLSPEVGNSGDRRRWLHTTQASHSLDGAPAQDRSSPTPRGRGPHRPSLVTCGTPDGEGRWKCLTGVPQGKAWRTRETPLLRASGLRYC